MRLAQGRGSSTYTLSKSCSSTGKPLPGFIEFLEENYYTEGAPFEVALWYWETRGMPEGEMPDVTQCFPDYLPGAKEQLDEWAEVEARETIL